MSKTIDSARKKTLAELVDDLDRAIKTDPWSYLGKPTKIEVKGEDKSNGYGGGWVARHAPEMLEEHDCHHSQYGEDGCDCDLIK